MTTFVGYLFTLVLFVLGCLLLVIGWEALSQGSRIQAKDLILFLQIALSFIGAVVVAILTAMFARSNLHLQAQLNQAVNESTETFRAKLAKETGIQLEQVIHPH